MSPQQHLTWFEENVAWFEELAVEDLKSIVPNCPGWSVEDVVNHLSFGLGLAYPVALSKAPETAPVDAFEGVAWPLDNPTGYSSLLTFSTNMRRCLAIFNETNPERPCWTYAGPGTARFWFRRAAIETTMHRMDVEGAVRGVRSELPADRTNDAVVEAVEFALPLAAAMTEHPDGMLTICSSDLSLHLELGEGRRQAEITGGPQDILCALWGRNSDKVSISGDRVIADEWLSLIETAFAGR